MEEDNLFTRFVTVAIEIRLSWLDVYMGICDFSMGRQLSLPFRGIWAWPVAMLS